MSLNYSTFFILFFCLAFLGAVQKMLIEKFGIIDTNRFINGIKEKRTESVKRHQKWQKELNEKEFLDQIFS